MGQTNKSPSLTSKLSAGVADQLKNCNKMLSVNLSNVIYNSIKKDFILYLKVRSSLYRAIALKYNAKLIKQNEKGKKDKDSNNQTSSVVVMKKSINKQMQSVKTLLNAAQSENNSIYFEVVPKSDAVEDPEPKFVVKAPDYKPSTAQL